MDPYVLFFFIPLAWFVTVFALEVGSLVMIPIIKNEKYRDNMMAVVNSLWAIIATSLVFLVVSLDALFAPVMYATGEALFGVLMAIIIFLAFHHFFIGVAEGADSLGKHSASRLYLILVLPFALVVTFLGNTIFTSVFSGYGIGINLQVGLTTLAQVLANHQVSVVLHNYPMLTVFYPNFVEMIFNPFNWVFFLAVVLCVLYFTIVFYGIKEWFLIGLVALTLSHALFLASTAIWLPVVFHSAIGNPSYWIYVIITYALLYAATHYNIPWRQAWISFFTFIGVFMFWAIQSRIHTI